MSRYPTLLAEEPLTDVERAFIDVSPPGVWPENQDSNFGQIRKVICDILQECVDFLSTLNIESTADSSTRYLSLWEGEVGLPADPSGKTLDQRRSSVLSRLNYGLFTRTRRVEIVESFLLPTFGEPVSIFPSGVELTPGGVAFFVTPTDVTSLYSITEYVEEFRYTVEISSTVTPDMIGLKRELQRITPAHISFAIFNELATFPATDLYPSEHLYPGG